MTAAADPAGPIVGYRSFDVQIGGVLRSLQWTGRNGSAWADPSGVARTYCIHTGRVALCPLEAGCPCGLHGYYRPPGTWRTGKSALLRGAIVAWGHVILHDHGFRAEHARVVGFVDDQPHFTWHRDAADRYSVPLLPLPELEQYAAWHGDHMPLAAP